MQFKFVWRSPENTKELIAQVNSGYFIGKQLSNMLSKWDERREKDVKAWH